MGILGLLNIDYTKIVNEYIETIFDEIARKEGVSRSDITFTMRFDGRNGDHASKYILIKRDHGLREEALLLPDDVVKKIIMNAKRK